MASFIQGTDSVFDCIYSQMCLRFEAGSLPHSKVSRRELVRYLLVRLFYHRLVLASRHHRSCISKHQLKARANPICASHGKLVRQLAGRLGAHVPPVHLDSRHYIPHPISHCFAPMSPCIFFVLLVLVSAVHLYIVVRFCVVRSFISRGPT